MTDIDIENYPLDGESILLDQITCYVEGIEDVHFWKIKPSLYFSHLYLFN